jgi:hypothetical protein
MSERERRLALNEAMFRAVNERVEDMTRTFESDTGTFEILCECADTACTERLSVPTAVYERVRADPTHFLLHGGHEDPTVERVIETHESYIVVEKEGRAVERVVEQTDPRADE